MPAHQKYISVTVHRYHRQRELLSDGTEDTVGVGLLLVDVNFHQQCTGYQNK